MNSRMVLKARSMKTPSLVIPLPYITHEYSDFVLDMMMYCVRSAVNK